MFFGTQCTVHVTRLMMMIEPLNAVLLLQLNDVMWSTLVNVTSQCAVLQCRDSNQ